MTDHDELRAAAENLQRLETPFDAYVRWRKDGNTADADRLQAWDDARAALYRALAAPPTPTDRELLYSARDVELLIAAAAGSVAPIEAAARAILDSARGTMPGGLRCVSQDALDALATAVAGSATSTEDLAVLARIGRMYLDALDDDPANEMLTLPEAMAVTDVRDAVERAEAAAGSATPTEPAFVFEGTFDALAASRGWWDHGEYRWVIYAYTAAAGSATPEEGHR